MVEQGLSFTVVDAPHPLAGGAAAYDARQHFRTAHRVWLGGLRGTDWLHEAVEAELGKGTGWYQVYGTRRSTHAGAFAEVASVVLILMGAGLLDFSREVYRGFAQRMGEVGADAALEWARERSRERRQEHGQGAAEEPPNFFLAEPDGLAAGMKGELAEVLGVDEQQLELVSAARPPDVALQAVYRDAETGRTYEIAVGEDWAQIRSP